MRPNLTQRSRCKNMSSVWATEEKRQAGAGHTKQWQPKPLWLSVLCLGLRAGGCRSGSSQRQAGGEDCINHHRTRQCKHAVTWPIMLCVLKGQAAKPVPNR